MLKDLLKKYWVYVLVALGVIGMSAGLLCHHPQPSNNAGFVPYAPGDTSSTHVTVSNNTVQIEHGGKETKIPKHHNSVVEIYTTKPTDQVKPSGGGPLSPSTTIVVGGDQGAVIRIKNWGFICQGQLEGGANSHAKAMAGLRVKLFHYHGFGVGAGINTSGFNLIDVSHELPKISMVDATLGLAHTTFEAKKELVIKGSFAVNLW